MSIYPAKIRHPKLAIIPGWCNTPGSRQHPKSIPQPAAFSIPRHDPSLEVCPTGRVVHHPKVAPAAFIDSAAKIHRSKFVPQAGSSIIRKPPPAAAFNIRKRSLQPQRIQHSAAKDHRPKPVLPLGTHLHHPANRRFPCTPSAKFHRLIVLQPR